MSERDLWSALRDHVGPFGRLLRVENALDGGAQGGTPDVLYLLRERPMMGGPARAGWIELKHLPEWPRDGGHMVLEKLRTAQVEFALDWQRAGGRAWMLLQVERDYLLLNPVKTSLIHRRLLSGREAWEWAAVRSRGRFPDAAPLIRALTR